MTQMTYFDIILAIMLRKIQKNAKMPFLAKRWQMQATRQQRLSAMLVFLLSLLGVIPAEAAPTVDALHVVPRLGQPLSGRLLMREDFIVAQSIVRLATADEYQVVGLIKPK